MLNRNALLFSPTREGVPSSDDNFNALDLVAAQDALEAEARDAVPYASECTYDLGYIKQPLYSCRTCLNDRAVCVACSVACHAEHDLVELFNRRDFRCDCGTEGMGAGSCCQISDRADAPRNDRNRYDHNFRGEFCWCGRAYDPHTEENDMIQCLVCEDWCHEPCLMAPQAGATLRDDGHIVNEEAAESAQAGEREPVEAVLTPDDFDVLICQRCVRQKADLRALLERYAGVEGTGVVVISETDKVLGGATVPPAEADDGGEASMRPDDAGLPTASAKRDTNDAGLAATGDETRPAKRARVASPPVAAAGGAHGETCLAPRPAGATGESPLRRLEARGARLNVYLQEGWMDRWCRCHECLTTLLRYPYLLEEEEVYEPPEDPDASKSTFELGMEHLLTRMPREQALDSISAFAQLSERLKGFLRPHAEGGTAVTKADIDAFFEAEREQRAERQRG